MKLVAARTRRDVDHAARVAPEFGVVAVGLHTELRNRVRARHHVDQIPQGGVGGNAVVVNRTLARTAADLIFPAAKIFCR